jgi:hypothetical protein
VLLGTEPEQPVAGQPFTIRLEVTDRDTFVLADSCWNLQDWGDGTITAANGVGDGSEPCEPEITDEYCERVFFSWHHGPWDPPGTPGGDTTHFVHEIEHTYSAPGTYTATFTYPSRYFVAHECADPFEETGTFQTTITVSEA